MQIDFPWASTRRCVVPGYAFFWDALGCFASALEVFGNAYFGWRCLRSRKLEQLVRWVEERSLVTEADMMCWLGRFGWTAWFCSVVCGVMWAYFGYHQQRCDCWWMSAVKLYDHLRPFQIIIHFWFGFFGFGPMVYLVFLWLWVNLLMHKVSGHLIDSLGPDLEPVSGSLVMGWDLMEILEKMDEVSKNWAFNHTLRFITTTVLATAIIPTFR
jgi:hypothetical protein